MATTQQNLEQKVMNVVYEVLTLEERDDIREASFTDDLSLSSLERMTLFIALEDEFERTISQEEVENIDNIQQVIDFIDAKTRS